MNIRNKVMAVLGSVKSDTKKFTGNVIGAKHIKAQHQYIVELGKATLVPEHKRRKVYNETFEEAVARLGVTDEDIKKNYKNFVIIFYTELLFVMVLLGLASRYVAESDIIGVLSSLSIMLVCLALCFKYSFRAYQIKIRKLCSIGEYVSSGEYFPVPRKMTENK